MAEGITTAEKVDVTAVPEESKETPGDEDANHHLSGWPLTFLAIALMASSFMLALDNTILGL